MGNIIIEPAVLTEINQLLEQAKHQKAWDIAKGLPPLNDWREAQGRTTARRLCNALGDSRRGYVLGYLGWRENPEDDRSYFNALFLRAFRTPFYFFEEEILERLKRPEMTDEVRADLMAFWGYGQSLLREFPKAHQYLDEALSIENEPHSWVKLQKALIFEREDQFEKALEMVTDVWESNKSYTPSIISRANLLTKLQKQDEAVEFLEQGLTLSESPEVPLHLSGIFSDRDDCVLVKKYLDDYLLKSPLLSKKSQAWVSGRLADIALLEDDMTEFSEEARKTRPKGFHQKILKYYEDEPSAKSGQRKKLDVEVIRQHHMTCAPATLAMISKFYGDQHHHLEIADAICHDGTPWHKEKIWCLEKGYKIQEFSVTFEAAQKLIDAGIPFTLTTEALDSAHLQACIGYDSRIGVLILRDPSSSHYAEVYHKGLFEDNVETHLRGLAFVPPHLEAQLSSLELPETEAYDLFHEFSLALENHQPQQAKSVLTMMEEKCSQHPLILRAQLRFASYRSDEVEELSLVEKQLALTPKRPRLIRQKITLLQSLGRMSDLKVFLNDLRQREEVNGEVHRELGSIFCRDARTADLGDFYFRRALRSDSYSARLQATYARSLSARGEALKSLPFYRRASRLASSFEPYAREFFEVSYWAGKKTDALEFLKERADSVGDKSVEPHLTLLQKLEELKDPSAESYPEHLLQRFPEDGDLMIELVGFSMRRGDWQKAHEFLSKAKGLVSPTEWRNKAAMLAKWEGDIPAEKSHYEAILEISPSETYAYRAIAGLIEEQEGEESAFEYIDDASKRLPELLHLREVVAERAVDLGPDKAIPILKERLEENDNNLWAIRQLALEFSKKSHHKEAKEWALLATVKDPSGSYNWSTLSNVQQSALDFKEAGEAARRSLALDIDNRSAFENLFAVCSNFKERKEAFKWVVEQLKDQVSDGSAYLDISGEATSILEVEEQRELYDSFMNERPDLWHNWQIRRSFLSAQNDFEGARNVAKEMVERFPTIPRCWMELGITERDLGNTEGELKAFHETVHRALTWGWARSEYAMSLANAGKTDEALETLSQGILANPLDSELYSSKASLLHKLGETKEASETIAETLRRNPFYYYGWRLLVDFTEMSEEKELVENTLELCHEKNSHSVNWWKLKANVYDLLGKKEEEFQCLEKAETLSPNNVSVIDSKAIWFAEVGRYEEALEETKRPIAEERPLTLRGREAWVLMQMGHRSRAWDLMSEIARTEKHYFWAQYMMAQWSYNASEWDTLKASSERMVALRPNDSEGWSYLGCACEELGKRELVKSAYQRAAILEPNDSFAGRQLVRLHLEDDNIDEAKDILRLLEFNCPNVYVNLLCLDVALLEEKQDLVEKYWTQILSIAGDGEWDPMFEARRIFEKRKQLSYMQESLESRNCLNKIQSSYEAEAYGRFLSSKANLKKEFKTIASYPTSDEYKALIIASAIATSYQNKPKLTKVRPLIDAHRKLMHSHYGSWSIILGVFAEIPLSKEAVIWGVDWRKFGDQVQLHDFICYTGSLDSENGLEHAYKARLDALEVNNLWEGSEIIQVCAAFYEAATGSEGMALQRFRDLSERTIPEGYYRMFLHLTNSLFAAFNNEQDSARDEFVKAVAIQSDFTGDRGGQEAIVLASNRIAQRFEMFKGNGKKVIKKWGGTGFEGDDASFGHWFWKLLAAFYLLRLIVKFLSDK